MRYPNIYGGIEKGKKKVRTAWAQKKKALPPRGEAVVRAGTRKSGQPRKKKRGGKEMNFLSPEKKRRTEHFLPLVRVKCNLGGKKERGGDSSSPSGKKESLLVARRQRIGRFKEKGNVGKRGKGKGRKRECGFGAGAGGKGGSGG